MAKAMFLTRAKAARIHQTAVNILERTGVRMEHPEGRDLLLSAGAHEDPDGRLLIPARLVSETLEKVPRRIGIFTRDGKRAMSLRTGRTYFGPGGDALYNIDMKTGVPRPSTLEDVGRNVRLVDAIDEIDFVMSMASPGEIDPRRLYTTVFAEMVKNTSKPIVATAASIEDLRNIHRIGVIAAGGEDRFREKPFLIAYIDPNSPLIADRFSTERLLYCAEHEIPFLYASGANIGVTAPISLGGAVAQGLAESLVGMVVAALKNENLRFILGSNSSSADMVNGKVLYGAPEWFKTVAMYADMGRYYRLPTWGTGGCTDSSRLDAQAGFESYEGILLSVLSGPTMVHDVGFLSYGFLFDARAMVLAGEIIRRARHVLNVIDLSDEEQSSQAIDEVARGHLGFGSFLDHPHTATHFRSNVWLPRRFIQRSLIHSNSGESELGERLAQEVELVLASHAPKPIRKARLSEIEAVLSSIPVYQ